MSKMLVFVIYFCTRWLLHFFNFNEFFKAYTLVSICKLVPKHVARILLCWHSRIITIISFLNIIKKIWVKRLDILALAKNPHACSFGLYQTHIHITHNHKRPQGIWQKPWSKRIGNRRHCTQKQNICSSMFCAEQKYNAV